MKPLSLLTYYQRHKGHTALLLGIISLVTVGLYVMVALSGAIFIEPMRTNRQFLSKLNIVLPYGEEWAVTVMAQVRVHPGVEQVIPFVAGQGIFLSEVIGGGTDWFMLFTMPIPVTVLTTTIGTVSRILSQLDPVTVIERR